MGLLPDQALDTVSRRDILQLSGSCLAATTLARASHSQANTQGAAPLILERWPLAMQLWTISKELQSDLIGTLRAVQKLGFREVETARIPGVAPIQLRRALDEVGLVSRSSNFRMQALEASVDVCISEAKTLGSSWLNCSFPKVPVPVVFDANIQAFMKKHLTKEVWQANATLLKMSSSKVRAAGLQLSYHNHFMEFTDLGGTNGLDILCATLSPDELRLEIDLGWVLVSGEDILKTLQKYRGRIDLLHLKDMRPEPIATSFFGTGYVSTEVGRGLIDWWPTLSLAKSIGVKHVFVEQEEPFRHPVIESLKMSANYLTSR